MHHGYRCLLLSFFYLLTSFAGARTASQAPVLSYEVVAKLPHATSSYTEGFFYRDGLFYEGTGLVGHSVLLVEDPATGRVLQERDLPSPYFGEGIVDWGPELYQWTWQHHT